MNKKGELHHIIREKLSYVDLIIDRFHTYCYNPSVKILMEEIEKNKNYYLLLDDNLNKKKNILNEEFDIYNDLIDKITYVIDKSLEKIEKILLGKGVQYDQNFKDKIVYLDNIMENIAKKDETTRYNELVDDCLIKVNKLISMIGKLFVITKITNTRIFGVREYYDELKVQRGNLKYLKKQLRRPNDNMIDFHYVLTLIGAHLDLILTNVTDVLQYNTCMIKNIDTNLKIPSTFIFEIYKESISNVMNDLKQYSKTKKKEK